jgi:hypothetical protein
VTDKKFGARREIRKWVPVVTTCSSPDEMRAKVAGQRPTVATVIERDDMTWVLGDVAYPDDLHITTTTGTVDLDALTFPVTLVMMLGGEKGHDTERYW